MTCCNGRMFLVRVMHVHNYSTLPFTQSGSNTDTAPAVQPFTARPDVALNLTECETPLHFFSVFMDDTAWNFLVEHTNQYAAVKLAAAPPSRRSLYSNWRDVTMDEMKAFVGVILNMGVVQLPDIRDFQWPFNNFQLGELIEWPCIVENEQIHELGLQLSEITVVISM